MNSSVGYSDIFDDHNGEKVIVTKSVAITVKDMNLEILSLWSSD